MNLEVTWIDKNKGVVEDKVLEGGWMEEGVLITKTYKDGEDGKLVWRFVLYEGVSE